MADSGFGDLRAASCPLTYQCSRWANVGVLAKVYRLSERDKGFHATTALVTCKLVHALCASAKLNGAGNSRRQASGEWKGLRRLVSALPLRENIGAFLTPSVLVTMIGAVVARALEQATRGGGSAAAEIR
ncbi:hypothetical protein Q5P01_000245 [Channa striata]|uniref:Uncharacterized protein n=1 Tax=Channa striata TaxID=64152 RepID=A0AA88IFN8_CHASR|nr:hypothetical protein Q5P01_000245 [Channa striata]